MAKYAKTYVSVHIVEHKSSHVCLLSVVLPCAVSCLFHLEGLDQHGVMYLPISAQGGAQTFQAQKGLTVYSVGHSLPSKRSLSFHVQLLSRSSSPSSAYNHLGSGLMWGSVCGLTRISVTSPALLPLPKATYQASYNYNVDMRHKKQYYQGYLYVYIYKLILQGPIWPFMCASGRHNLQSFLDANLTQIIFSQRI